MPEEGPKGEAGPESSAEVLEAGEFFDKKVASILMTKEEAQNLKEVAADQNLSLSEMARKCATYETELSDQGEKPVQDHFDDAVRYLKAATMLEPELSELGKLQILHNALKSRFVVWSNNEDMARKARNDLEASRCSQEKQKTLNQTQILAREIQAITGNKN